jgi:hypothetical protein
VFVLSATHPESQITNSCAHNKGGGGPALDFIKNSEQAFLDSNISRNLFQRLIIAPRSVSKIMEGLDASAIRELQRSISVHIGQVLTQ